MVKSTPATVVLRKADLAFILHEYDYDPNADSIGLQAADALGVSPTRLFKTLMIRAGNEVVCALAPSDREISLKKLAAAAQSKQAFLLPPADAERVTGYHVGGISPFGQKRRVETFIDRSALDHATVIVNGGRRGLQIELAPEAAIRFLNAKAVSLC
ncbi:MAG: Cys-tRNA(Pro) deacylase [Pseudorhodoplanes sp.]